jgi:hypothetical protein
MDEFIAIVINTFRLRPGFVSMMNLSVNFRMRYKLSTTDIF